MQVSRGGIVLFYVSPLTSFLITAAMVLGLFVGSSLLRAKEDRASLALKLQREGRYVGTVTVVQTIYDQVREENAHGQQFRGVLGFDLHSNGDELGHYHGVGKLWVQGQPAFWPVTVDYLRVHQHAEDGSCVATLRFKGQPSWMPSELDFQGKIQPPNITFEADKGELTGASMHKGTIEDFDRLVLAPGFLQQTQAEGKPTQKPLRLRSAQ